MNRTVDTQKALKIAIQEWSLIAKKLYYKKSEITSALQKLVTKDPQQWLDIYDWFKHRNDSP